MTFGWSIAAASARLAHEALAERRILGQLRRDQLQRHGAVEVELDGPVDHAHATAAGHAGDPMTGEDVAWVAGRARHPVVLARGASACTSARRANADRAAGTVRADLYWPRRACVERHPRRRVGGGGRRRGRSAAPPPGPHPAPAGDRDGRRRAARPLRRRAALAQRATSRCARCRCGPMSRRTRCPTTTPSGSRARACDYPVRVDRALGLGELPGVRLQRALARPGAIGRADQVLVWSHWVWFLVPHGTVAFLLLRRPDRCSRAARRGCTRSSTSA